MTSDPIFITQVELASRWRISEATLERDRSIKKGVRYMKLGGSIRYRLEDVLAYEDSRMHETEVGNRVGLTLEEIEDIVKSNATITDQNLYEAIQLAIDALAQQLFAYAGYPKAADYTNAIEQLRALLPEGEG
jgi:hypothetical protein